MSKTIKEKDSDHALARAAVDRRLDYGDRLPFAWGFVDGCSHRDSQTLKYLYNRLTLLMKLPEMSVECAGLRVIITEIESGVHVE